MPLWETKRARSPGQSVCLGASFSHPQSGAPVVSKATRETAASLAAVNAMLPTLYKVPADFCWTSMQISYNTATFCNDANNEGTSVAFSLGNFTGGGLVLSSGRTTLNMLKEVVLFDGRHEQSTAPHTGDRWTLTFFVHTAAQRLSQEDKRYLISIGFRLPPGMAPEATQIHPSAGALPTPQCGVAERLAAAKPIRWAGRGELIQLPWPISKEGTVLVLDLWSGISSCLVALLALGVNCVALCVEKEPEVAAYTKRCFPDAVHMQFVEDLTPELLKPVLDRRKFSAMLVGGGAPCQANSWLNKHRKGLGDVRSHQPEVLRDFLREVQPLCESKSLPVLSYLENVDHAPEQVIQAYDGWMGTKSLVIDAGIFGWVTRSRRFWGRGPRGGVPDIRDAWLPEGASLTRKAGDAVMRWEGQPIPQRLRTADGFRPAIDPAHVVRRNGQGAIFTFTRRFRHPDDSAQGCSRQAHQRFNASDRPFPTKAFEDQSLMWRGDKWRLPDTAERAKMMGLPEDLLRTPTERTAANAGSAETAAQCAIGNAFHVPSFMLFLILLFQTLEARPLPVPRCLLDHAESGLASRIRGTVWEPGRVQSFKGTLGPEQIVDGIQFCFQGLVPDFSWTNLQAQMHPLSEACCLLQSYWVDAQLRGMGESTNAPQWSALLDRAASHASMGQQRAASTSKRGLTHLMEAGLGKEEHMRTAQGLPSPFESRQPTDDDLNFAARALGVWGPLLPRWREKQRKALVRLLRVLQPLSEALQACMAPSVRRVQRAAGLAGMALLTTVLRWPDYDQPGKYVQGFPIINRIETSGLYKQNATELSAGRDIDESFFGAAAESFIGSILQRPRPKDADKVAALVEKEIQKGYQTEGASVEDMNTKFGKGQWRPMPLFALSQASKDRLIADAKQGEHNEWTVEEERLQVISIDWIAEASSVLLETVQSRGEDTPDWYLPGIMLEDMQDAYRQGPVHPDHARANIVCWWDDAHKGWRFAEVFGMVFGMRSAVLNFNRLPTLAVAAARRCFAVATANYFDDFITLAPASDQQSAGSCLKLTMKAVGGTFGAGKAVPWARQRVALGVQANLAEITTSATVVFEPRADTLTTIAEMVAMRRSAESCSPAQAAKLRGVAGWAASATFNRIGRLGTGPLKQRQYHDKDSGITPELQEAFDFLTLVLPRLGPRRVTLTAPPRPRLLVYSDASWPSSFDAESGPPRLGWIIFQEGQLPRGRSALLPPEAMEDWIERKTQIYAAEAIVPLLALFMEPHIFRGHDVLWFIDNEAAMSSLIRGGARPEDVGRIAAAAHILMMELDCRAWFEWIDSNSNPSDGLSRLGLQDPWTAAQGWMLHEMTGIPWQSLCKYDLRLLGQSTPAMAVTPPAC